MESFETTVRRAIARLRTRRAPRHEAALDTALDATPRPTPGPHRALLFGESPYRCTPTCWGLEELPTPSSGRR